MARRRISRWRILITAFVILVAASIAVGLFMRLRPKNFATQTPPLSEKDPLLLTDFDNKTGDVVFDDALKPALAVELEQSPFLNVLSEQKIAETLRKMGRPANHPGGKGV